MALISLTHRTTIGSQGSRGESKYGRALDAERCMNGPDLAAMSTNASSESQIAEPVPIAANRRPGHPIEPWIVNRWSPRALNGEPLTDAEMWTLFEAARWAPSTYNEQEWRFLYARPGRPEWETFYGLLASGNQTWCGRAALLVVILSKKTFTSNGKSNPVHLFDCGSAFENLALQGTAMGLVVHGMQGFDFNRARTELQVPDDFDVAAMFAVGHPGNPADLPDALRKNEMPSDRKPLEEIVCEGAFKFPATPPRSGR
jgi:nitroreductase